ncbi:vacuolar protein sorting-associated protein 37D isoform X3 [Meriones unguiculatus]|uniref:vacuolar protein sorting-associated protein 37D isoform X3 n=1 Tax=Meriones unguiculatus TaxID=10047 RepID=UPI00293EC871|nr:vacuolar protein sorting-associated protein 37D isoform X3 [Meriones unguiculatus]
MRVAPIRPGASGAGEVARGCTRAPQDGREACPPEDAPGSSRVCSWSEMPAWHLTTRWPRRTWPCGPAWRWVGQPWPSSTKSFERWLRTAHTNCRDWVQMEQLLLGEQSLEAFLPAFQRGRALAHLRRTQAEKLQEVLRRRERSAQPAPTPAAAAAATAVDPPKPFPAAAVLPTGAARGPPPAVPRSLPPLDSRPVPPLKGSPGCPFGPAPLLSPRPSQPEPPHR